MVDKELIEIWRNMLKPAISSQLLKTNYEGMGEQDKEEFERDFDEILDLALIGQKHKAQLLQERTEERTESHACDSISRQAAIDALDCINGVEEVLRSLPSAQPEQRWILCDERMPDEHEWIGTKQFGTTMSDEVYVTFENQKGERFTRHLHFHNGDLSRYDKTHMDAWFKGSKPIAWMPLPEPYKGEQHG